MKKLIIPMAVVLMGTGAAFATKLASNTANKAMPTYRIDENGHCKDVDQECDEGGTFLCTWNDDGASQLYKFKINETTCSSQLYRSVE